MLAVAAQAKKTYHIEAVTELKQDLSCCYEESQLAQ